MEKSLKMKKYVENIYGLDYQVIEYDADDLLRDAPNSNVLSEIIKCTLECKYLKVVDKITNQIDYYKDGMKHNEFGPSVVVDDKPKNFHVDDKEMKKDVFINWKRTSLIDKMTQNE